MTHTYNQDDHTPAFENLSHLLTWTTETLRAQADPHVASVYKILKESRDGIPHPFKVKNPSYSPHIDKHILALDLDRLTEHHLTKEEYQLIRLYYWGDYTTPLHLKRARLLQEKHRLEGKRVRLNWRYSFRQIATLRNISTPTVSKRINRAHQKLEEVFRGQGYLA